MKKITYTAVVFSLIVFINITKAQNIYTVVGNGSIGFAGDGGPATAAELYSPSEVTFDKAGNYYIADEQNDVVREVNISTGIITTVAGTGGSGGFGGDGGPATSALMNWTIDVAFDTAGNMYITDRNNERIRKVTKATGIITTFVGTGVAGYNGDGILATAAEINQPECIAFDAHNNLYIADQGNNRIREVNLATGIITTVVGTGVGGFSGDGGLATVAKLNQPYGITFDYLGNMYIGDQSNYCVREVNVSTNIITTVAGMGGVIGFAGDGGPATSAKLNALTNIAVGKTGNIYIADTQNNRIRKVNKSTGIITTIVGSGTPGFSGDGGPAILAKIHLPNGVTLGDSCGDIYFPDWANQRIREIVDQDVVYGISGNTSICSGSADTLMALGGSTYLWSNGATSSSIIVNPTTDTTYSVQINNAGTCVGTKDTSITITVSSPLSINISPSAATICSDSSITLVASGGSNYLWSNSATTSSISINPSITTTYSVNISNGGCSKDTSVKVTVNPAPHVTLTAPSTICSDSSITLFASGGSNYLWSNSATTSSISINLSSTTTFSVEVSSGGCSKDTSVKITVNPTPHVTITAPPTICSDSSITLISSGGGTYLWSNSSTTSGITINPSSTTTYSVEVKNGGCSKDTSVKVTVNPAPHVTITAPPTICSDSSVTLIVSGGGIYRWSNSSTTSSITVNPFSTITYSVEVENGGCTKDTMVKVTVNPIPTITLAGSTSICYGTSTTIDATGGGTYLWNTTATTSSISVTPPSTTTYSLTVDKNGCNKDTTIKVTVNPLPVVVLSGSDTICKGTSTNLSASGGTTYLWSTTATTSAINVSPSNTTTYTVAVNNGTCIKDTMVQVVVNPLPVPVITGKNVICKGSDILLTASGGNIYSWSPSGRTTDTITVNPTTATIYTVTATNSFGCISDTVFKVTVSFPSGTITGPNSSCPGDTIELIAHGGGTYLWNTGVTNNTISVTPLTNTTYSVVVNNGCIDTVTRSISVDAAPQLYACCDTIVSMGTPVVLNASGTLTYSWLPSSGVSCDSCPDPVVTPSVTTTYTVIGTDSSGCRIEKTITVDVGSCSNVIIPNVFTPNGDDVNDEFVINAQSTSAYSIIIYDRWGKEMYQSTNPDVYWNGKDQHDNSFVPTGVYYYIIKYTCSAKSYTKDGFVQVIR